MTKLDDLRKELKTLKNAAIEAICFAQGQWTGLEDDGNDEAQNDELLDAAKSAESSGDDALTAIEESDVEFALDAIEEASGIEYRYYPDYSPYTDARAAVKKWATVCEEVLELRAIAKAVKRGDSPVDIASRVEHDYPGDDASALITLVDALGEDAALDLIQVAGWSDDRTQKALTDAY